MYASIDCNCNTLNIATLAVNKSLNCLYTIVIELLDKLVGLVPMEKIYKVLVMWIYPIGFILIWANNIRVFTKFDWRNLYLVSEYSIRIGGKTQIISIF